MNKKICDNRFDFNDSSFKRFEFRSSMLTLWVELWDEKMVKIQYHDVLFFSIDGGDANAIPYVIENTDIFCDYASKIMLPESELNKSKLYHIEDVYDNPYIKVIAKDIEITFV